MTINHQEIILKPRHNSLSSNAVTIEQANNRFLTGSDQKLLLNHSKDLLEKNLNLNSPDRLHVVTNKSVVESAKWNDVHVFQNLNKTSTFNEVIRSYKADLSDVEWVNGGYYRIMAVPSKALLDATLSTIYYTEGHKGLNSLSAVLPYAKDDMSFSLASFYPVYNTILYFAPWFLMCEMHNSGYETVLLAPYETISLDLQIYIKDFAVTNTNLNFISRIQLRFEAHLPDVGYVKDLYSIHFQNRMHNFNVFYTTASQQIGYYGPRLGVPIIMGALTMVYPEANNTLALGNNERQLVNRESISAMTELIHDIIWPT